jgi:Leucine-rich repeat (LRR) protein
MDTHTKNNHEIQVRDTDLAAAIRDALDLPADAPIRGENLQHLTRLRACVDKIIDLTGLEHATQLTTLVLSENLIRDISPLAALTKLETLDLEGNSISDISPLAALTKLETLDLDR